MAARQRDELLPVHRFESSNSGSTLFPLNRKWCFLVKQRVAGSGLNQTMHPYADSFAQALEVAMECSEGWQRGVIFAVLSPASALNRHVQEVDAAYLLVGFGILCCLESWLHLLDPYGA